MVSSCLLSAPSLGAQSLNYASLSGVVTTSDGSALRAASITLTPLGVGTIREATTTSAGAFGFQLVPPGSYEVRAEALGFRPVVARILTLTPDQHARLSLRLASASPPVLTIDTVRLMASGERWRVGAVGFGAREIDGMPHRFEDLGSLASMAPWLDGSLGGAGLPGSMTLVVADGVPIYRAAHPLATSERDAQALVPRSFLGRVTVYDNAADVEWSGSAGGYVAVDTRREARRGLVELDGAWSGSPLWSSSQLEAANPSLLSLQGAAGITVPLPQAESELRISGEGFQQETPLAARISDSVGSELAGLDPDLLDILAAPSVERLRRFSALARVDRNAGAGSRFFLRGGATYLGRTFEGPGPVSLGPEAALPEESLDLSVAGGWVSQVRPTLFFEIRGGVSGSDRRFDAAREGLPAALLVSSASSVGVVPGGYGESSRVDVHLLPAMRVSAGAGVLKLGGTVRRASHSMQHVQPGEFFFSDGAALVSDQGFGFALQAPSSSFTTRELGAFAQYVLQSNEHFRLTVGGRYDWEAISEEELTLARDWFLTTGTPNNAHPTTFNQLGGVAAFELDPVGDGATVFFAAATVHHGDLDPRALGQLYSQDGDATSTYYVGAGIDWPSSPFPSGATSQPTLTLLGPDTRPPRSMTVNGGGVRRLTENVRIHAGGSYRRTDFMLRRRNLNLPLAPVVVDAYGRNVWAPLAKDGSLVTATDTSWRRFPAFGDVWALDPDGWSKQRSVRAGVEYMGRALSVLALYARSETTDNWSGAASGSVGASAPPLLPETDWDEAPSDFDTRHRLGVSVTARVGLVEAAASYRFSSGLPFTPRYRSGVDANGDGSYRNDVAFIDANLVDPLLSEWPCLANQLDRFAGRNSCRGPSDHALDASLRLDLGDLMGRPASLVLDGLNLLESEGGVIDDALLLVDPTSGITTSPDGSTMTVPVTLNAGFGKVLYPASRGRMMRVGFSIGLGQ